MTEELYAPIVYTNIPEDHAWFVDLMKLRKALEYPLLFTYSERMERLINSNNVYFQCNAPGGKSIVAACNALFRALLNLSMALGEYDDDNNNN